MKITDSRIYKSTRKFARAQLLNLLGTWSIPAPGIHILNGHRIENEPEPETFLSLLKELSKYVTFVRIENAVKMVLDKNQPDKPLVAFTFDDGFMEDYDLFAPLLEEFNTNALFFINPNYVEGNKDYIQNFNDHIVMTPGKNPMRWQHLTDLSNRGHLIGAHTMDHFMINTTDLNTLEYQIVYCKKIIEKNIGKPCDYFAFPYGKLSQANQLSIDIACKNYPYVFSQSDYKHYLSFSGKVINRRHFEPFWPKKHVKYFISCNKTYL